MRELTFFMRELTVHPAYIPVVRVIASFSFFLTSSHYRMYVKHTIKIIINEASEFVPNKMWRELPFLVGFLCKYLCSSTSLATLKNSVHTAIEGLNNE